MTFPRTATDFWHEQFERGDVFSGSAGFSLTVKGDLPVGWQAEVLERTDGSTVAAVSPELARTLRLVSDPAGDVAGLRSRLAASGFALQVADRLFYIPTPDRSAVLDQATQSPARVLGPSDARAFSQFQGSASKRDLDDAYVELDHWAIVGVFEGGRLVCAASAYPWRRSRLADIGVLTIDSARGKGYGRAAVLALCAVAYGRGYEPQYRCQPANRASAALALAVGFAQYGTCQIATGDPE
jgi:GNAT superfamily N-acetyltransferase